MPLIDGAGVEKPFKNDFGLGIPPLVRLLGPVGMGCRTVVDVFGVVFDDVELEDAALAWASEVNNALGARGGALPDIVEDDDVGENKRDSALTTTTTSASSLMQHLNVRSPLDENTVTHSPPRESVIPVPFSYTPSDDGVDENLLILLHGLGDTHVPFANLGKQLKLPQTATLSLRAPEKSVYCSLRSLRAMGF